MPPRPRFVPRLIRPRVRATALLLAAACALAVHAHTHAQPADGNWIGKRVITKYGTQLQVEDKVVDVVNRSKNLARGKDITTHRVYTVSHVNGPWLWLKSGDSNIQGWALAVNVIPCDQAIDYYTSLIRANPGSSAYYVLRGSAWSDEEDAIADFNEAIRLDPSNESAYHNRGNAWSDKKDYDKAIADYNEAIRLDPKDALAYNNRGNAWSDKQDHDKAIADYNEAIRLDPGYVNAYNNRGIAWLDKKDYDKAIADYNEAIRLDAGIAVVYNNRGNAWRNKKDYDKAIEDYNEAIRLDPEDAWPKFGKTGVRLILANPEGVGDAKKAIAADSWKNGRSIYAAIVGALGARRTSQEEAAKALLDEADAKADKSLWPYPVVKFLRGEIDDKALMDLATDNDRMTEVRCFLGYDQLFKGDPAKARENFQWVKDHGTVSLVEYHFSIAELDRMDQAGEAKP